MRLDDFPTPAQTSVYIGDVYIDDAFRVSFEVEHPRVPLYGYNKDTFSVVADGKILVTGNLTINYRFPGYLQQAISLFTYQHSKNATSDPRYIGPQATPGTVHHGALATRAWTRQIFEELKKVDSGSERLAILTQALDNGTFREASLILEQMFSDRDHGRLQSQSNPALSRSRGGSFDIQVMYGDGYGPQRVDLIRDCFITGMGKSISASAGGGDISASGMPIYEIYPFIARTIEHHLVEVPYEGDSTDHGGEPIPTIPGGITRDVREFL